MFVKKSVNRMNVVIINNSVRPITDKEMKKFAEKFAFFTVIEKGRCVAFENKCRGIPFIWRKELQKEHSDYFKNQGLFPSGIR